MDIFSSSITDNNQQHLNMAHFIASSSTNSNNNENSTQYNTSTWPSPQSDYDNNTTVTNGVTKNSWYNHNDITINTTGISNDIPVVQQQLSNFNYNMSMWPQQNIGFINYDQNKSNNS